MQNYKNIMTTLEKTNGMCCWTFYARQGKFNDYKIIRKICFSKVWVSTKVSFLQSCIQKILYDTENKLTDISDNEAAVGYLFIHLF